MFHVLSLCPVVLNESLCRINSVASVVVAVVAVEMETRRRIGGAPIVEDRRWIAGEGGGVAGGEAQGHGRRVVRFRISHVKCKLSGWVQEEYCRNEL